MTPLEETKSLLKVAEDQVKVSASGIDRARLNLELAQLWLQVHYAEKQDRRPTYTAYGA